MNPTNNEQHGLFISFSGRSRLDVNANLLVLSRSRRTPFFTAFAERIFDELELTEKYNNEYLKVVDSI